MIEDGADLRAKNKNGETALAIAEQAQLPDVIALLKAALAHPATPSASAP